MVYIPRSLCQIERAKSYTGMLVFYKMRQPLLDILNIA